MELNKFNAKLKEQADKRKAKVRAKFEAVQPMSISAFARKFYPNLSRSMVDKLLRG